MALLAFLAIGLVLGWFASILERDEDPASIRLQVAVGALASVSGAILFGGLGGLFGALQLATVGIAAASAVVVLSGYWYLFIRKT